MFCRLLLIALVSFSSLGFSAEEEVQFLTFGDFGTGDADQRRVASSMESFCSLNRCDFVVGLGDNFYPAGVSSTEDPIWKTHFESVYGRLGLTFYAALGNHDYDGDVEAQIAYTRISKMWQMPARYFKFSKGHVDFFALDTNKLTDAQLDWLNESLKASTAPWKIVYGHTPMYSGGMHGDNKKLQRALLPLLEKYGVDLYLAGHDHDKQLNQVKGRSLLHVVSGAVSQVRPVKSIPQSLYASDELGFVHIKVIDQKLEIRFTDDKGKVVFTHAVEKPEGVAARPLPGPGGRRPQQEEDRRQESIEAFEALAG